MSIKPEIYKKQFGGVALEYVMVSTFATLLGAALLGVTLNITKKKLTEMAEQLEIDTEDLLSIPFLNSN